MDRIEESKHDSSMDDLTHRRVRSACDSCHTLKMKCSGGYPCTGCDKSKQTCIYSEPNRLGRPKGSKNKKTQHHSRSPKISDDGKQSTERDRTRLSNENRTMQQSTASSNIPLRDVGLLPSAQHLDCGNFLEHDLTDASTSGYFGTTSISDISSEQQNNLFDGLEADMGLGTHGSSTPFIPFVSLRSGV